MPLKGGPFDGQRRPIVDGHIPATVERRWPPDEKLIQVYERKTDDFGADYFAFKGARAIGSNALTS